jgi:hypothetical protein
MKVNKWDMENQTLRKEVEDFKMRLNKLDTEK